MRYAKTLISAAIAVASLTTPTSASAVNMTFATFTSVDPDSNVLWTNAGTGGTFISTSDGSSSVVGSRAVSFSFINTPALASLTNISALFTLNASAPTGNAAVLNSGSIVQNGISGPYGTMSFITTSPFAHDGTFYATGSNLLTLSFSGGGILGSNNGTSGGFFSSNVTYLSDFLDLSGLTAADFGIGLSGIAGPLSATSGSALNDFRAVAAGNFSGDGFSAAVPEPSTWAMMIVGFGIVGAGLRRRRQAVTVTFG